VTCLIGPGSYIEPDVFFAELERLHLSADRVRVDGSAVVISDRAKRSEQASGLGQSIGSTMSGTGAAVQSRIARDGSVQLARFEPRLQPFLIDSPALIDSHLTAGSRVIVEGTQGFGLSVLHSHEYPYVTSRDTSAAAALSEAGISPRHVDEVVMVLRAHPIRVGGHSGPMKNELDWRTIEEEGGHDHDIAEFTSVTQKLRRVARFDAELVRRAISVNAPTHLVLNHLDYIDHTCCQTGEVTPIIEGFVQQIETEIGQHVDYLGLGPDRLTSARLALQTPSLRSR
jgi:adenylosuccinate synthase